MQADYLAGKTLDINEPTREPEIADNNKTNGIGEATPVDSPSRLLKMQQFMAAAKPYSNLKKNAMLPQLKLKNILPIAR
jgi:hypothetical protein